MVGRSRNAREMPYPCLRVLNLCPPAPKCLIDRVLRDESRCWQHSHRGRGGGSFIFPSSLPPLPVCCQHRLSSRNTRSMRHFGAGGHELGTRRQAQGIPRAFRDRPAIPTRRPRRRHSSRSPSSSALHHSLLSDFTRWSGVMFQTSQCVCM